MLPCRYRRDSHRRIHPLAVATMALTMTFACSKDESGATAQEPAMQPKEPAMTAKPPPKAAQTKAAHTNPSAKPVDGKIPSEYRKLKQSGCDFGKYVIATPLEARVLRNTPYALQGKSFEAPELGQLFALDGNWYKPKTPPGASSNISLAPEDEECVKKLAAYEKELRARIQVDPEIEAKLTSHPAIFLGLRAFARPNLKLQHGHAKKTEFEWQWTLLVSPCQTGEECQGITLVCSKYGDDPMSCEVHEIG